jgi:hypothetical protein
VNTLDSTLIKLRANLKAHMNALKFCVCVYMCVCFCRSPMTPRTLGRKRQRVDSEEEEEGEDLDDCTDNEEHMYVYVCVKPLQFFLVY